jgi:hypothetical protein
MSHVQPRPAATSAEAGFVDGSPRARKIVNIVNKPAKHLLNAYAFVDGRDFSASTKKGCIVNKIRVPQR